MKFADAVVIFLGSGLGGVVRFGVRQLMPQTATFWSTFAVNVVGCFFIGLVAEAIPPDHAWKPFITIGVLGGFTTFSTYAADALQLGNGEGSAAMLAYVLGTVVFGLMACILGSRVGMALRVA